MLRIALTAFFASLVLACSQPCDPDHVCNLDQDGNLCDGKDYRACDDSDRGQQVACKASNLVAVCSNSGWAFQHP